MSDIFKHFLLKYYKISENVPLINNSQSFPLYKNTNFHKIFKLPLKRKKESFLTREINSIKDVNLKLVRISKIDDRSKKKKNINLRNKLMNYENKSDNSIPNVKSDRIFKSFEFPLKKIKTIKRIQSTKILKNYKDIDQKIFNDKVNLIIKKLLSKDFPNYYINDRHSRNLFPLNQTISPMKYVEYNMQNEPENSKLYQSYSWQMKCLLDNRVRNSLIGGINNYNENLKNYKEIYFDNFFKNNNFKKKLEQDKIINFIHRGINKENINILNRDFKNNDLLYNSGKDKFKNEYIKLYNQKGLNKAKNLYFKYTQNNEIKKMMSLDDKIKSAYASSKNLLKFLKRDRLKSLKEKNIINDNHH